MLILATVVSRPTPTRAVIDAGSKALTSDLLGFTEYGEIEGLDGARIVSLSEEHGVVDLSHCSGPLPQVGDQVRVVPNHTCVASNLFDRMVFHRDGQVTRVEDLLARGTVWRRLPCKPRGFLTEWRGMRMPRCCCATARSKALFPPATRRKPCR